MGKLLKFAGNKINRLEVERREEEWIKQKFKDPKSKVIIYFKSKILIRNNNHKISYSDVFFYPVPLLVDYLVYSQIS